MDQVHVIRHQVLVEGRSQRSVAREHGVSRNTVRKYMDQSEPRRVESKPRRRWVTERVAPRLEELLRTWSRRTTAKQRLTATRLHRQLLEDGYEVGTTTVRSYVREWKRQRQETFIPLVHRAGERGQVDFFEVTVEEDGVAHRVWKFLLHLPYSGRSFVRLYDRCDQVAFLDGHVRAFAHFGGVPLRVVYDNLSAAVRRRVGAERQLTARFQALVSHYLFEPCFARPGEGHDKGSVESRGKGIRLTHMSPVPQGRTLEEIAWGVLASVDAAHGNRARWQEEQAALCELPATAFEARKLRIVRVSRQATVQLGGATYSVPSRWKSLQVHTRVGTGDIVFTCRDAEYRCALVRPGQRLVRYAHYFEELSRKPQAVRQVAPELLEDRLRAARFPDHKTLEQIDFKALQGVSKPKLRELAACDYIDRGDDVVLVGPIGTGKTHLAIALGIEAAKRRRRVWFRKASDLLRDLLEARDQRELGRLQQQLQRVDLLICDELGFVPFDRAGGELLFNVFADRYERRSTIVTSNLAFSEWVRVFGDEKLTTALLDRLSHHAHIFATKGSSYRTRLRSTAS